MITLGRAQEVIGQYGVALLNPHLANPIARISEAAARTLASHRSKLSPLVAGSYDRFKSLALFINENGAADTTRRAEVLLRINQALNRQIVDLNPSSADRRTYSLPQWDAFSQSLATLTPNQRTRISTFYGGRSVNTALKDIIEMTLVHGLLPQDVLRVIAATVEENGNGAGITPRTIRDLCALHALHPPNTAFPGFAQWGPGDHGTPENNLRWHFLKHVCGISDEGDVDFDEAASWWRDLRMNLTWAELTASARYHVEEVRSHFDPSGDINLAWVSEFLRAKALLENPRLVTLLVHDKQYERRYRDFAIRKSREMSNVIVQANGEKVFISGAWDATFIIGRLSAGVLGISSAYIAQDIRGKLRAAATNRVWSLT